MIEIAIAKAPAMIDFLKDVALEFSKEYDLTRTEDVTRMLVKLTEIVKKGGRHIRTAVREVESKLGRDGSIEVIDRVIHAAAEYMKCLMEYVPLEFQAVMLAAFDLILTSVSVVTKEPRLVEFAEHAMNRLRLYGKKAKKGVNNAKKNNAALKEAKNNA